MERYVLFGGLILLAIILISAIGLLPSDKESEKKDGVNKKEEKVIFTWLSPNGMWFTTKIFIVGFALMFITPKYVNFKGQFEYLQFDVEKLKFFLNSLEAEVIPLNTWTKGDFLFIIVYISVLLILVNVPIRYTITTGGIYYGIFGFNKMAFRTWSDVVCFDLNEQGSLQFWFRPPLFKPDWNIPVPHSLENKLVNVLRQYTIHYNVSLNKTRKRKIFDLDN